MNDAEALTCSPPGRFRLKAGELSVLAVKSNAFGLRRWFAHWLSIVATAALVIWLFDVQLLHNGFTWPQATVLTLLLGYLLAFQFSVLHECAHQTAFRRRALNLVAGHLAAWLIVLRYHYYRAFHWDHHRHTLDPKLDPELAGPLPSTRWSIFIVWSGIAGWRLRLFISKRCCSFGSGWCR